MEQHTILQKTVVHIHYCHRIFVVLRHWIPGSLIDGMVAISVMAECESKSKIMPYHFETVSVSNYSDDESDSSKSKTNIREQASFTE